MAFQILRADFRSLLMLATIPARHFYYDPNVPRFVTNILHRKNSTCSIHFPYTVFDQIILPRSNYLLNSIDTRISVSSTSELLFDKINT